MKLDMTVFLRHGYHRRQQRQNLQVLHFDHAPPTGVWDISDVWGTNKWTYSPSLVTVSLPKLYLLHFLLKQDGVTD